MNRKLWPAVLLAVALTATGCANTIAGTPGPGMTPVDMSGLRTGAQATEPTEYEMHTVDGAKDVRLVEARRMLNFLVHPFDVDSEISTLGFVRLIVDPYSMTADGAFPEAYRPVAEKFDIVAGAYVSRTNGSLRNTKKLIISTLRFPTEAASRGAVEEFDRVAREQGERHPVPVTGYPDAHSSSGDDRAVLSFQAHGPYVVVTNAGVPQPDPGALGELVRKTLDKQLPALDAQQPIPLDDVLDLPIDPDGIMRRAAPTATDYTDPFFDKKDFGPFEPEGVLHFERNPVRVRQAFESGGVDLVGRRASTVYRTRDLAASFALQNALVIADRNDEEMDPPPGLPDVRCLLLDQRDDNRQYNDFCVVVYGRYVAVVYSSKFDATGSDQRLMERTAAQYEILAKSDG
ncbi:DUF7373 family lipoprotein [Nocardia callitridis]|uniref:Uncharacterized protein n=1 Tax=Nocardia callitridis TaxID=648753 RepID=A0ABP9KZG9_9NOCA